MGKPNIVLSINPSSYPFSPISGRDASKKIDRLVAERNPQAMPVVGGWFHPAGFV